MVLIGPALVVAVAALLFFGRHSLGTLGPHKEAATPVATHPAAAAVPQKVAAGAQSAPMDTATKAPVSGPEPLPSTINPGQVLSPSVLVSERSSSPPPPPAPNLRPARNGAPGERPAGTSGGKPGRTQARAQAPEREIASPQYAIVFGHYSTSDMARAESDYLSRLVPLRVRVSPTPGGNTFHLVMGRFETSEAAEQSLRRFQRQGLVEDAKVTKIPRWTAKGEKTTATGNRRAISL